MGQQERINAGKFLTIHIGNVYGAMGLLGNIMNEGGANIIANRMEISWKKKTGWNDGWIDGNTYKPELDTINPAINNGTYRNYRFNGDGTRYLATFKNDNCRDAFANDAIGFGICQWTWPARKYNLFDFCDKWCRANKKPFEIGNLEMQLDYILEELRKTYTGVLGILMTTNDLLMASNIVCVNYERPQGFNTPEVQKNRYISGLGVYKEIFNGKDTQWFKYNNKWYYLQKGLILKDKWLQDEGKWYYLTADGSMSRNSWVKYQDDWYYMNDDGSMATNKTVVWNGQEYRLDETGKMI